MRRNRTEYRSKSNGHEHLYASLFRGKELDVELIQGKDFTIDAKSLRQTLKGAARARGYEIVDGPEVRNGGTVVAIHVRPLDTTLGDDDELDDEIDDDEEDDD